jgi:ribosomal-protein-alanine N-acetyltransferase
MLIRYAAQTREQSMIETDRLLLRPFERADAADVFGYASNPNVSRYTSWSTHRTLADSEAFIDMVLSRGPGKHTWAVCLREESRVVAGANPYEPDAVC